MSEKKSDNKEPQPVDDIDAEELLATTQANISNELAKKIWSVTSSDVALGIREYPGEKLPYVPLDLGSFLETAPVSGNGCGNEIGSKLQANENATAHILEVGRALYGETYGFPENDNPNYYKAAENYALFGEYFLDFPKDTATCFADLEQAPDGDPKPPPGLERSNRSSLPFDRNQQPANGGAAATASGSKYSGPPGSTPLPQQQQQQRQAPRPGQPVPHRQPGDEMSFPQMYQVNQAQLNPSHHQTCPHMHGSHVHPQAPVGSAPPLQQQQKQQQRPGGALINGSEIGGGGLCGHSHVHNHGHGHAPGNEFNLSQLYQQLMARNMRPNPLLHQPPHQHQQHMAQSQHHHHTTTCAAAAAAMIYANFEQHIRQLQFQQQIHQQQQRHARIPRGIYGGNGGQVGPGPGAPPAGSGTGTGGVGATPPASKEPPATGHK
ncbi:hypothetical protein KR054_006024 [Drosophila jambulina]|nr:hypothetical protein KR054_006024 [Drosophila jambulina]